MELRHLRYFVAVAEDLSFTKAAARLHLAQPSLTRQIHNLEEEIGVRLLNVLKGSVIRKMVIAVLLFAGLRALLKGMGVWP